jgi:hypothetical protein
MIILRNKLNPLFVNWVDIRGPEPTFPAFEPSG